MHTEAITPTPSTLPPHRAVSLVEQKVPPPPAPPATTIVYLPSVNGHGTHPLGGGRGDLRAVGRGRSEEKGDCGWPCFHSYSRVKRAPSVYGDVPISELAIGPLRTVHTLEDPEPGC